MLLICTSSLVSDIEHLFMCLLAICISFLVNFYSDPLPIFQVDFSLLSGRNFFNGFFILTPYQIYDL